MVIVSTDHTQIDT